MKVDGLSLAQVFRRECTSCGSEGLRWFGGREFATTAPGRAMLLDVVASSEGSLTMREVAQRRGLGLPRLRGTRGVRVSRQQRSGRGVRLSDLDRSQVYRIGYVGRRWEVLGPDDAPDAGAGPATAGDRRARDEVPRPPVPYVPRHVAPAAQPG